MPNRIGLPNRTTGYAQSRGGEDLHAQGRRRHAPRSGTAAGCRRMTRAPRPMGRWTRPTRPSGWRARCARTSGCGADIVRLQEELFIAGAELATAPQARDRLEPGVTALDDEMVAWIEEAIDGYMAEVEPSAQLRDPRRHRAVGAARRRPHRPAAGRAADRGPGPRRRAGGLGGAALRQPRFGPRLGDVRATRTSRTRGCSRAAPARARNDPEGESNAQERAHARAHGPRPLDRSPTSRPRKAATTPGPGPARAARAQPRLLHRDDGRDVRRPQGLGRRRPGAWTSTTSSTLGRAGRGSTSPSSCRRSSPTSRSSRSS